MDLGLAGKRALVTGGSRGIGRACALALAREGAKVLICGRTQADLEATLAAMGGKGSGHASVSIDLLEEEGPRRLVAEVTAGGFGYPEIVVQNVGGTLGVRDPLAVLADWRRVWRFNVEIAIELTNAVLPEMRRKKSGRIIFLSSLAAFEQQGSLAYGVTKAALTAYARGIGRTYAAEGIVVSAVVPGVTLTQGGDWERNLARDPEGVARFAAEKLPRGRLGSAEEIADAVTFLASERATAFVGSLVPLDAGQGVGTFGQ